MDKTLDRKTRWITTTANLLYQDWLRKLEQQFLLLDLTLSLLQNEGDETPEPTGWGNYL